MPRVLDLTGQRFGHLSVIERGGANSSGVLWRCRCDCGRTALVRAYSLVSGATRSCGCQKGALRRAAVKTKRMTYAQARRARDLGAASVQRQSLDAAWDEIVRNYAPPRVAIEYWGRPHD